MTFKRIVFGVAALSTTLCFMATAQAEERHLFIYNWADYIGSNTIADFEKETGIKVTYDTFDSVEMLDARVQVGSSGYDIIFPDRYHISKHVKQGVYLPLDKSKLKNLQNIGKRFWKGLEEADPGNQYVVPYMYWTTGYAYDAKKILAIDPKAPVDSWDMFFKPEIVSKFASCGVSVLNSPEQVMDLVLNYRGLHPGSNDQEQLRKAGDTLKNVQPYITAFDSTGVINSLADGSRCLAITWSGDYAQARARAQDAHSDVDLRFVTPKEGVSMDLDGMAILKDAKNVDEALEFIDYMMRPDVIAKVSNEIGYANANDAATPLVDPAIRQNPALYPDPTRLDSAFTIGLRTPEGTRLLNREFTRAKTGQ